MKMTARVFVTTYGLYNNGMQFANKETGYWIDCADYDADEVFLAFVKQEQKLIDEHTMDVEIMFTDYENMPDGLYSECGIDFDLIERWENLEESEQYLLEAIMDHCINDFEEAIDNMDHFHIHHGSAADYAQEKTEECHDIPDYLSGYIDYESMAHDMDEIIEMSHDEQLINYGY